MSAVDAFSFSKWHWKKSEATAPRMSPLKTELDNLLTNIKRTKRLMEKIEAAFWRDGGICCPGCGCPGYRDLESKQERREKRIEEIRAKLMRDESKPPESLGR